MKKLYHVSLCLIMALGTLLITPNNQVNAQEKVDLSNVSDEQMPIEVREILEKINSGNVTGNSKDGFTDYNESLIAPSVASIPQQKYNSQNFGHSNKGMSVIQVKMGVPGFWQSLYQNKYDGWGYTSQQNGSYTPSKAIATVTASATGVIPNISTSGSSWGLFNTTKQVGKDTGVWSKRKYAQAYFDNVRIQHISNLTVKFEVKSELHYASVGSRTASTSVRFF
ncbi:hypothetical protein [Ornithinibacillus scapharcae]|uniref:hypothetical protein n=1 Tax=Ornithinibacillus scapharcae TaxID=1147159 RepID=UPI000225AB49|nr:hypothetical protein [Ornithinibacillus scapharcae]